MTANQMAGYDADTGKLVAKRLGVEPCFVTPTWSEIISGHWNDRWDIAYGSGAINSDRAVAPVLHAAVLRRAAAVLRREGLEVQEAVRPQRQDTSASAQAARTSCTSSAR